MSTGVAVRTHGAGLRGILGIPIAVEVDAGRGLPAFHIVGCANRVVSESRDRIRAAFRSTGIEFPPGRVTVNLAPSELPKTGSALDLAIAVAVAATRLEIDPRRLGRALLVGELGLDGTLRGVRGTLALLLAGQGFDCEEAIFACESLPEARLDPSLALRGAPDLGAVLAHLRGDERLPPAPDLSAGELGPEPGASGLEEVLGQESAKRALAIAAAGGHALLMSGPPGAGKTLLAERLPCLLPPLGDAESLEVTRIHSVAGTLPGQRPLRRPPLRAPHHSTSTAGLLGGGQPLRPGELTLAHRGVLFLDELPEWRRGTLESLRQPLESGRVQIARASGRLELPARFQLVAAMNPCPCGFMGDSTRECTCDPALVRRYLARLSGPLLDRIDLQVQVAAQPDARPWRVSTDAERETEALREQVQAARAHQQARAPEVGAELNAALTGAGLRAVCRPDHAGEQLLGRAAERLGLSLRTQIRVLRVARTISDMGGRERVDRAAIAEALSLRGLDSELRPR